MAARSDPQEHLKELRTAIDTDLTELGRRWHNARDDAQERGRHLVTIAGFVSGLVQPLRQVRAARRAADQ